MSNGKRVLGSLQALSKTSLKGCNGEDHEGRTEAGMEGGGPRWGT